MSLSVKDISFSYGRGEVLKDISFHSRPGECLAILGSNGVGKSTLLKCLLGLLKPTRGQIIIGDQDLTSLEARQLAQLMAYVPQQVEFGEGSVFEAVMLGRRPFVSWRTDETDQSKVEEILESLNLSHLAFQSVNHLSGGEKQQVAIARALAQEPKIILFDEPTSSLDIKNQVAWAELMQQIIREKNISVIVTLHDINLALRLANRFIMLENGRIFAQGKEDIVCSENIAAVYGIETTVCQVDGRQVVII